MIDPVVVEVKPPKTPFKMPKLPSFGNKSTKIIVLASTAVVLLSVGIFVTFTVLANNSKYKKSHNIVTANDEIAASNSGTPSENAMPGQGAVMGASTQATPDAPLVKLMADKSSVDKGGKVKLSWTVTNNPTSCTASEGWSGAKPYTGAEEVTLIEFKVYKFILTCKNDKSTGYSTLPINVTQSTTSSDPGAPVVSITASPASVYVGQSASITWTSTNSSSCIATGDWSGDKPTKGSSSTGPLNTAKLYTYGLTCKNAAGKESSKQILVDVTVPPPGTPIISIIATSADNTKKGTAISVTSGTNVTISWTTSNIPGNCDASGDWSGSKPNSGSQLITGLTSPGTTKEYNYNLQCANSEGTLTIETITITVLPPIPVATLNVSASTIPPGGSANLTWSSMNSAASCTASGDWSGTKAASGSQNTGILNTIKTYTYSISCNNDGGQSATVSKTITVQAPPVVSLSASPISVTTGGSATLSWSASNNPSVCTASGDWSGTKVSSSSINTGALNTVKTYSYTLSCTNGGGTGTATTTIAVTSGGTPVSAPVVTISTTPTSIGVGSSSTINWAATNNPTSCTASGSWTGSKGGSGSTGTGTMSTAGTYTYSLSCSNSAGSGSGSATVTVIALPGVNISLSPSTLTTGGSSTITWSTTNSPSSCTASGNWTGAKTPTGGTASTGAMSTAGLYTYTLGCTNAGGTTTTSATLTVNAVTYCGGLTPCYGPADLALHATTSNCWGYQTSGASSVLYNLTNFAPRHSGGSNTILTTATCGKAISWSGAPNNGKHTAAKSNTQATLNGYKVGYYDAAKP